jgi:multidrug resistance efflux pump
LDDAEIAARIETERLLLEQLKTQLESELLRTGFREAGLVEDRRRFQVDEQSLRLEILSLRVVLESDQIELERRNLQVERTRPLFDDGVISINEFDDIRLSRDLVARRIDENRILMHETEEEHHVARVRRDAFVARFPGLPDQDPVLLPLGNAVRAQEQRIEEIQIQRRALTLRSPVVGQVSQVLARRGQSLQPGEPLLFVLGQRVSEILAYAPESAARQITVRSQVAAARRGDPSLVAESIITRVGPSIEQMPQRMWRDPGIPEYGLPFVVAAVPALKLTPGEIVEIRVIEP